MAGDESKVCLLVLAGLPGVGKTTFARGFKDYLEQRSSTKILHVCYDEIISLERQAAIAARAKENDTCQKEWKEARAQVLRAVKVFLEGGKADDVEALEHLRQQCSLDGNERRLLVIMDDNNYYQSMRHECYRVARSLEGVKCGFCQIYFPAKSAKAVEGDASRKAKSLPAEFIEEMARRMEPPDPLKNEWEKFSFAVNLWDSEQRVDVAVYYDMCSAVVDAAFENPVVALSTEATAKSSADEMKAKSRSACASSVLHQCDKMLRKILGKVIQETAASEREKEAARLNEARLKLLRELRLDFSKLLPPEVVADLNTEALEEALTKQFELTLNSD